ncbi:MULTISPECIES: glycosyltransferase [Nocardiopsis]|uniref:Glycosyl transferase n=1 Tax=Nocardiopsis sinuspersici TaxID=501010 RepID=A0A1V3BYJ5_9ACTN|nr:MULTISPECIES: glycosyltransferase [Nocardiopsis]OOC53528.1 glycosyl transferase [Nocardiopsis sinuspersici]
MRIAMVSEHASPLAAISGEDAGGQNVHVAELATALAARGHEVAVYTRRTDAEKPDTVSMGPGVRVEHVRAGPAAPISKDELPRYMPEFAQRLRAAWRIHRPDVVHAHFWMSGFASLRAANTLGLPVLQTFHALGTVKHRHQGSDDTSPVDRIPTERAVASQCDMVVATSTEERRELGEWGVPPERVAVVPCGVDTSRFTPKGPAAARGDRPRLLSLGRLVRRKGVDTVIRALAEVPEAELVIAGGADLDRLWTQPEAVRLRMVAERMGVEDRVRFLGCVDRYEVPALLRSVDAAVNVPWYEPFGISTVEAMACGVPVVASRVGGHVDTVVHGETGLLVPPRSPKRLGRAMRWLLSDEGSRSSFAEAAAERARERYSWAEVARRTEECYLHVTGTVGAGVPAPRAVSSTPVGTTARGGEE